MIVILQRGPRFNIFRVNSPVMLSFSPDFDLSSVLIYPIAVFFVASFTHKVYRSESCQQASDQQIGYSIRGKKTTLRLVSLVIWLSICRSLAY